jgi:hypothetical protein
MNQWGRRSFLGRALTACLVPLLKFAQPAAPKNPDQDALNLIRSLNTIQVGIAARNQNQQHPDLHFYGSRAEMLGDIEPGLSWQKANNPTDSFLQKLSPKDPNGEVLAGWTLGYRLITGDGVSISDTYVMTHISKVVASDGTRKVFVSDQIGVIYRGDEKDWEIPAIENMKQASDYPHVVPFNRYYESRSSLISKAIGSS